MHIHMYVGALIGFTDIGNINSHLDEYENQQRTEGTSCNFDVAFDGQGAIH